MHFLEHYQKKIIKYDLINKYFLNKTKKIPKIKKIILNFGCKNNKLKFLSDNLLALELITSKKGTLTKTKHSNILLKIRKGNPVGCKVVLVKKQIYYFLTRFIYEVLPITEKYKILNNNKNKTFFCFKINNTFVFPELEKNYYLFNELGYLDIVIVTNSKSEKKTKFIFNSFKLNV